MSQSNELRSATLQWLRSLQLAGVRDLPAESSRQLGNLVVMAAAEVSSVAGSLREAPADYETEKTGPGPSPKYQPPGDSSGYGPPLDIEHRTVQLAKLSATVAACTRCPELSRCRTQTVFGVGAAQPRLCFFGEAPGADEDRLGQPFVGRAGELLDRIIGACKMNRHDVYIFNTVKCRPPGNRNPLDEEINNCREYFEQQLQILQPEFICCLGSVAARTLLGTTESIGRLRGTFHTYRSSRVVVTYHPAYLLRTPAAKAKTWEDMKMLMAAMGVAL